MMTEPFREVGVCGCAEHRASARLKEIIRDLKEEIRIAKEVIGSLQQDLGYWRDAEDENLFDPAHSVRVGPVSDSALEDQEGFPTVSGQEQLRLPGVQS